MKINFLGNLHTKGGGEQSLITLAKTFSDAGHDVHVYSVQGVLPKYKEYAEHGLHVSDLEFRGNESMHGMRPNVPLLFYANDSIYHFLDHGQEITGRASDLFIGINFVTGNLHKTKWLEESKKLRAVIFQNTEKESEFLNKCTGYTPATTAMYGAIDLSKFANIKQKNRSKNEDLVVLKHSTPDGRKYVTSSSYKKGKKCHVWQEAFEKELDIKFYGRMLEKTKNVRFRFMEAHRELQEEFRNEPRMDFLKWDEEPVDKFLSSGHLYLYRTSNDWRDNYPRVIAEALASGLPVLGEPRDGALDRIQHGDTGLLCVDFDQYFEGLKKFQRKETWRYACGQAARLWATKNLNPENYIVLVKDLVV